MKKNNAFLLAIDPESISLKSENVDFIVYLDGIAAEIEINNYTFSTNTFPKSTEVFCIFTLSIERFLNVLLSRKQNTLPACCHCSS